MWGLEVYDLPVLASSSKVQSPRKALLTQPKPSEMRSEQFILL